MPEYKISWKVLKMFAQECSNCYLELFMARLNLPFGLLYGKNSWILLINTLKGEHKNTFLALEAKIIL